MTPTKSIMRTKRITFATIVALVAMTLTPAPALAANFTVTYSNTGYTSGTVPTQQTVAEGATFTTASTTTLAKTGFTFNGWSTAANYGGTVYAAGGTFTMPAANVTLYPVWSGTISYNANSGVGSPTAATTTFNLGQSVTLTTGGSLTRSTYTFVGWKTEASATSYTAGGGSFSTASLTTSPTYLYAAWARTYSFNVNGATVGATPANKQWDELTTGADLSGIGTDLKRRGYDFAGWSTTANGPALVGLFSPTTTNQVLYAVWSAQPAKRSFGFNVAAKKYSLTPETQTLLSDFAKTFDQTVLFPKSSIKIFVGSTRHSSVSESLGKKRIDAVIKYLKSLGVNAKYLWSNDVRKIGKATDQANNRIRIISTWTN